MESQKVPGIRDISTTNCESEVGNISKLLLELSFGRSRFLNPFFGPKQPDNSLSHTSEPRDFLYEEDAAGSTRPGLRQEMEGSAMMMTRVK